MKSGVLAASLGLLLTVVSPPTRGGEDAAGWLERMGAAMSQMNYQGTFVYIQGEDVDTMRITHVAEPDGVRERLVSVSGAPREVLRDAQGVRWYSGGKHGALSDPAGKRQIFFELPLSDVAQAADSYDFVLGGYDRVAGHKVRRVEIRPRDRFRYGYTLWLEVRSGLLLQWRLSDREGDTLARLLFTDVRMGSAVDREELVASAAFDDKAARRSVLPAEGRSTASSPAWVPESLPPGFRLASHRSPDDADRAGRFEHLVYSDGIAAVSVYIEALGKKSQRSAGTKRMGTTHAYFRPLDNLFVTVVGDVPEDTVKLIGEAVRPVEH